MKLMKVLLAVMLIAAMSLGMASVAMAEDTIKMGVIGPLTGGAAIYGNACKYGAQVAADEINAMGGLQIELLCEDDEHDPEKSINAYNTVLDQGAQMIVGTTTTAPCLAVSAQAFEDRVFMMTPSASNDGIPADKDNMYQICFQDPQMGIISAQIVAERQLGAKIAVIYNNSDDYSTTIAQYFMQTAKELGLNIVEEQTFTEGAADFSVQVTAAKDAEADLLFLPIYYEPASKILQTAKNMEYAPFVFGVDGMDGILTLEGFDVSLAEGVVLLTPFSASSADEKVVDFVAKYQVVSGGETPNQFAADAYDAVYALYQASVAAGITGETSVEDACEMLIEQFQTIEVSGLTGDMTWTDGVVNKQPAAYVIKNGAYEPF